ncbi:MAG TPA: hypothetical protein VGI58_07770 [Streptosporangiaceae bacterium]
MSQTYDEATAAAADLARLRQSIHAEPELGLSLPRTQRKVIDALADLPVEITLGASLSSVTAVLRGSAPGKAARPGRSVLLGGHGRAARDRAVRRPLFVRD